MKEILSIVPLFIKLITPNPEMKGIKLKRKELKLAKKNLRIAERMYKSIYKEFKKDGFDAEETALLNELKNKITQRKADFI
jgi:ribosomal protein L19E